MHSKSPELSTQEMASNLGLAALLLVKGAARAASARTASKRVQKLDIACEKDARELEKFLHEAPKPQAFQKPKSAKTAVSRAQLGLFDLENADLETDPQHGLTPINALEKKTVS